MLKTIEELDNQLPKKKNLILLILAENFHRVLQAVNKAVIVSIKNIKSIGVEAEAQSTDEEKAKVEKKEDLINSKEGQDKDSRYKEAL